MFDTTGLGIKYANDLANAGIYLVGISPGLVGALSSGLFVSKSTWTSRAVGFAVGEGLALSSVFLLFCGVSGPSGRSLGSCAAALPGALPGAILNFVLPRS